MQTFKNKIPSIECCCIIMFFFMFFFWCCLQTGFEPDQLKVHHMKQFSYSTVKNLKSCNKTLNYIALQSLDFV
jgi:hypothetical protein